MRVYFESRTRLKSANGCTHDVYYTHTQKTETDRAMQHANQLDSGRNRIQEWRRANYYAQHGIHEKDGDGAVSDGRAAGTQEATPRAT